MGSCAPSQRRQTRSLHLVGPYLSQTKHVMVWTHCDRGLSSQVKTDTDRLRTNSIYFYSLQSILGINIFGLNWPVNTRVPQAHSPQGRKRVGLVWSASACGVQNGELCSVCNRLHAFDLAHPHRKIRLNKSRAPKSQKAYQMCYRANKIWSPSLPSAGLHILITPIGFRETNLTRLKTISGADFEMNW